MTFKTSELKTPTIIAVSAIVTVLVVLLAGTAIRSLVSKLSANNDIISKKRAVQQKLVDNQAALEKLKAEFENIGGEKALILDALPTKPDFTGVSAMIENIASTTGVVVGSVTQVSDEPSTSEPSRLKIKVQMAGSYEAVKSFLGLLEVSLRPMIVNSVQLSGTSGAMSADLDITTYYQTAFDTTIKTEPIKSAASSASPATQTSDSPNPLNPSQGVSQ